MKTKKIRKRGFWKKDPENHPLLMEVQLGKSVEELCEEHFSELEWENGGLETAEIVQEIIKLDDPNIRFAVVDLGDSHFQIIVLNSRANIDVDLEYRDDDDAAADDCDLLNKIVERLFGIVREKPEAKITDKQYIEEERCPFCLHKKLIVLDEQTWNDKVEMGCARCGETWYKETKVVITGFSR